MKTGIQNAVWGGNAGMPRRRLLPIFVAIALLVPRVSRADDAPTQPEAPTVSPQQLAAEAQFREGMRRPVSVDAKDEPWERTIARVSRQAMVPISMDWYAGSAGRPDRDIPISLRLQNVPADRVLRLILRCATDSQSGIEPKLYIDADGVHIVPELPQPEPEQAVKTVATRYDVSDLIRGIRIDGRSNEDCFDDLQRLIEVTVAVDTWLENGGQLGKIFVAPLHPAPRTAAAADDPDDPPRGGSDSRDPLVVTTTPALQIEVAALLSNLRNGLAGAPPTVPVAVARAAAALQRPVPATFRVLPLRTVLDSIGRAARINLFVDWVVLSESGITPETLVTMPAPPNGILPAADAMSAVFKALAQGDNTPVSFDIDTDGIVEVGQTSQAAKAEVITCCYNIRGLLQTRIPSKLWPPNAPADQRGDAIEKQVMEHVATDTWLETGGAMGIIRMVGPLLIVTQTPLSQERVAAILQRLP